MEQKKKEGRYQRLYEQLKQLTAKPGTPLSRMATICAVLHHKMDYFFWTGFYLFENDLLTAGPYQGPVACQKLEKGKGVCWAAIQKELPLIVPDVSQFPDHIACDARSKSEICIPVRDKNGVIRAVLDVDSSQKDQFNATDEKYLSEILKFIYK